MFHLKDGRVFRSMFRILGGFVFQLCGFLLLKHCCGVKDLEWGEINSTSIKQRDVKTKLENKEHHSTNQLKKEETEKCGQEQRTGFTNSMSCTQQVNLVITASGSLSLSCVFVLLLLHFSFSIYEVAPGVFSILTALDIIAVAITIWKFIWARNLENKNRQLQKVLQKKKEDVEKTVSILMDHKKELVDHKDHLKSLLAENETTRERNKQKLQLLEMNITEGDPTLDKLQLLKEKGSCLEAQWKLEQTKKNNKTQLMHTYRLLELTEIQVNTLRDTEKKLDD